MTQSPSPSSAVLAGMGACYALGTFTDNFYKQGAVLLAAAAGLHSMQSLATVLFALPFILFSAWAGWLADTMPKKQIVVAAKSLEVFALLIGAGALARGYWPGMLLVVGMMGLQSAIFSPAINGSIPEHFPSSIVPRANALIKMASTTAILAGIALAGFFLDTRPDFLRPLLPFFGLSGNAVDGPALGRLSASLFALAVGIAGLFAAFALHKKPKAGRRIPFPLLGPLDSVRHALRCRRDKTLTLALLAEAWFYGIAALALISVANLSAALGYSNTMAGLLSAALTLGIAAGALIGGRRGAESWRETLPPTAVAMGCMLTAAGVTPLFPALPLSSYATVQQVWFFAALLSCGVCGGMYLIPLASFVQVRPPSYLKGRIQGVSNFLCFSSMAAFGALFRFMHGIPPALTFALYGVSTIAVAALVRRRLSILQTPQGEDVKTPSLKNASRSLLGLILRGVLSLRYKVRERGLDAIALRRKNDDGTERSGMLILPNHPALIDPVILYSRLAGLRPRPLADARQMESLPGKIAARLLDAVTIPDLRKEGKNAAGAVMAGLTAIGEALRKGDVVLLYPAGRLYRSSRESLGANSAVAHLLTAAPDTRVVLARAAGLWGSAFSYADGKAPHLGRELLRGLLTLLRNGIFFTPRRKVDLEFIEPDDLPRDGDKMRLNAYLERFYNAVEQPDRTVPRRFRQESRPLLPREAELAPEVEPLDISPELRKEVFAVIRETLELPPDHPLELDMRLSADLRLDSLGGAELAAALETRFGAAVPDLEDMLTVQDCLLIAAGRRRSGEETRRPAPQAWFAPESASSRSQEEALSIPAEAATVPEAFLRIVRDAPSRPLLADRSRIFSRRRALMGVLALRETLRALPDERIGVMLPAVPAAVLIWLAAQLAGKVPVMLNWTAGSRNMLHCLELTGVTRVISAAALLKRLERTGDPVRDLPVEWIHADALAAGLSPLAKARAAVLAALHCLGLPVLAARPVPKTAAILFTSGSEAAPKAVPLSHANLMTNARDLIHVLGIARDHRLLAMLPPFHSFGLMAGLVLPAASGMAAAYHPNPTESAMLVDMVRDYKLSMIGATPTFLEAMLGRAHDADALASLRYAFVGAEKCPAHVYDLFARRCPDAFLCEGYGITECSPVVSVNRPGAVAPGSIGHPLPSVRTAVVSEDENGMRRVPPAPPGGPGEQGMLLVRGESVFSGYLGAAPDPFVTFEGVSWYRTGDLATQDAEGRLAFKGRLKRFVKIAGEMISLPQMENVLLEFLREQGMLPDDGAPCLAVEAPEKEGQPEIHAFATLDLDARTLNAALQKAGLSALYSIRRVTLLTELPLLGSGKIDYRTLKASQA